MATRKSFPGAEAFFPARLTLKTLRAAADRCQGCDLYLRATQTVFGEGAAHARVVFVGEQPGDKEDKEGKPFVGPAGRVFDKALEAAGIARALTYVTNTVKHFSFEERGKARLHKRPKPGEVRACTPWLRAELAIIKPRAVVLLGATAAQSIFGASFRITQQHGQPLESDLADMVIATLHPSAILRARDAESREQRFQELVSDLKPIARLIDAAA